MFGLIKRAFKIGEAHANKALDEMEDPAVMLEQAIRDKDEQLAELRTAVMKCIASEKQTKRAMDAEYAEVEKWAANVKKAGDKKDLALAALKRAEEHKRKAETYKTNWENQHKASEELKLQLKAMEEEQADLKRNKDFIISQSKMSEVKKDISSARAKLSGTKNNTDDLIARMKQKIDRTSAEAEAASDLAELSTDSIEKQFDELSSSGDDLDIEDRLAALKK